MSVERRGTKGLELWAKKATQGYAGVSVDNMTTSWRNGLAFCALIHHFRPDLIAFDSLKAENVLENNALAYRVAEQHLGIPALLDAEDMLESLVPDRLSILTYVSQFYQSFGVPTVIKSPKEAVIIRNTNTSSPLTPQKTTSSAPTIMASKAKQAVPSKKEADFKTDKVATGNFKVKREACHGCQKPVFIAERILVGSPIQLRHRTCFRCARCTTQLTLANYYVTEKGQFCCETCPDEEKSLSSECSTIQTAAGTSSDSDSASSVNMSADQSTRSDTILVTNPHSIVLSDSADCPTTLELPSINEQENAVVEAAPEKPPRSIVLQNDPTENIVEESTNSENISSTITDRLNFFENNCEFEKITKSLTSIQLEDNLDNDIPNDMIEEKDVDILKPENEKGCIECKQDSAIPGSISVESPDSLKSEDISKQSHEETDNEINQKKNLAIRTDVQEKEEIDIYKTDESYSLRNSSIKDSRTTKELVCLYPDDLNPFESDESHEAVEDKRKLNPFGSSDEDDDEKSLGETKECSKKNLNPFWSDDEEYLHNFPQTPSKTKSPPPRPPPPTLKRNEVPHGKISAIYSSNVDEAETFCSISALSSRSHTPDLVTLRIKKKQKPAPIPPSQPARSTQMDKNKNKCLNDNEQNISKEDCDDVLSSKKEKDKRNQSSKLNEKTEVKTVLQSKHVINSKKLETGEWKRKKGPAPPRPVPQKRTIRALPMSHIQLELVDIEVKQTELERQGVIMETLIRSKTETPKDADSISCSTTSELDQSSTMSSEASHPGVEVEDLILQLFELVNEKNELFRRQTELMYLKREKRLEEEHAELEYQIRCSMLHPNRTEDAIRHEEELITRLMKVVEQRDQIVNCLELERQREAVEDESIAIHMIKYQEKYIEGIDSNEEVKLKKKKTKLRLLKRKKKKTDKNTPEDADKDVDETEVKSDKKKKRKWFKKVEIRPS